MNLLQRSPSDKTFYFDFPIIAENIFFNLLTANEPYFLRFIYNIFNILYFLLLTLRKGMIFVIRRLPNLQIVQIVNLEILHPDESGFRMTILRKVRY